MAMDNRPGQSSPGGARSGQSPLKLIGAGVVVLAIGILVAVVAFSGGDSSPPAASDSGGLQADEPLPSVEATIDLARATATPPDHLTGFGPDDRLVIPKFNASGPLAIKAVGADGVMPDPSTPDEVAYYDFSAWPGLGGAPGRGGNAIFSGHVDSGSKPCKNGTVPAPCQAVFWDLRNLKSGDELELHLSGQVLRYKVTGNQHFPTGDAPWDQIVSATAKETITVITCTGSFINGEYNSRQVLTAERII
jgi:LPXTG-site transpeptidase (sortase) family protein